MIRRWRRKYEPPCAIFANLLFILSVRFVQLSRYFVYCVQLTPSRYILFWSYILVFEELTMIDTVLVVTVRSTYLCLGNRQTKRRYSFELYRKVSCMRLLAAAALFTPPCPFLDVELRSLRLFAGACDNCSVAVHGEKMWLFRFCHFAPHRRTYLGAGHHNLRCI